MSRLSSIDLASNPAGASPALLASVASARVLISTGDGIEDRTDWVVVEEPLEIRAGGFGQAPISVAVTMRTPGHDPELAVGFLWTEGLIAPGVEVISATPCGPKGPDGGSNVIRVVLSEPFDGSGLKRNFFATSSCGICGKATLDQVALRCPVVAPGPVVGRSTLLELPGLLRQAQAAFDRTGGLHAAGIFDADGLPIAVREDVGRHNAVDKLIGRALLDGKLPLSGHILMVSGRTSFEILQKAAAAGLPIVCAVSAPSSLAISAADQLGITLVGFLRGSTFNLYTHPGRIDAGR
ncbi:formate dehydrogenase accessory sulfurtransferase FdhD [Isosphaeraceae bacterium EP7]